MISDLMNINVSNKRFCVLLIMEIVVAGLVGLLV